MKYDHNHPSLRPPTLPQIVPVCHPPNIMSSLFSLCETSMLISTMAVQYTLPPTVNMCSNFPTPSSALVIFFYLLIFTCVGILSACMSVHHMCAMTREARRECQIPWDWSRPVGVGNQTQTTRKSSLCSNPWSHLSGFVSPALSCCSLGRRHSDKGYVES